MEDQKDIKISEKSEKKEIKKGSQAVDKFVSVTYKFNRKFDLHIGRDMLTFMGRETKRIPKSWVDHKDFEPVNDYFVIKGV